MSTYQTDPRVDDYIQTLPGWQQPLDRASSRDDLPDAARRYVEFVERGLDVPVELVGVGAARERVLV